MTRSSPAARAARGAKVYRVMMDLVAKLPAEIRSVLLACFAPADIASALCVCKAWNTHPLLLKALLVLANKKLQAQTSRLLSKPFEQNPW